MPRITRIDRADAFRAIEAIIQRGEAPTHINVRAELGQRGSPPVISNFISSWFAVYGPTLAGGAAAASPQAVAATNPVAPAALEGGAIAALTAAALEQIQRAASEREAEQDRLRQQHEQAMASRQATIEKEAADLALVKQAHEAHVERAYADRDAALKERDLARADAANLRATLAQTKAQLAALEERTSALERIESGLGQVLAAVAQ